MGRSILMCGVLLLLVGCTDKSKEMEAKYDQLQIGMTTDEVKAIMGGEGKAVSAEEVAKYPENVELNKEKLPADTEWVRWGDGYPYVLAGFSKGKLELAQVLVRNKK